MSRGQNDYGTQVKTEVLLYKAWFNDKANHAGLFHFHLVNFQVLASQYDVYLSLQERSMHCANDSEKGVIPAAGATPSISKPWQSSLTQHTALAAQHVTSLALLPAQKCHGGSQNILGLLLQNLVLWEKHQYSADFVVFCAWLLALTGKNIPSSHLFFQFSSISLRGVAKQYYSLPR